MKRLLAPLMALAACALLTSALAANAKFGIIAGDDVLVREQPNTQSDKLGSLDRGQKLIVLQSSGNYYKIRYKSGTGYVADKYVAIQASKTGVVNADNVVLRDGPSKDTKKLATLKQGEKIRVYHKDGEFYQVTYSAYLGYIADDYVSMGKAAEAVSEPQTSPQPEAATASEQAPSETVPAEQTPVPEPTPAPAPKNAGKYTDDELLLLSRLVHHESNGTKQSCEAVASVIYNRLNSSKFPDTVYEVVFQKSQFTVHDDESFKSEKPSKNATAAVYKVFVEGDPTLPSSICYFKSSKLAKSWGKRKYYKTIAGNHFYS